MADFLIKQEYLAKIRAIIKRLCPNAVVWAYGSRVGGDAHSGSDLDLAVKDFGQTDASIATLKEAFEESNIPFLIDLTEFDKLPISFQQEIEKKYIVIYRGTADVKI